MRLMPMFRMFRMVAVVGIGTDWRVRPFSLLDLFMTIVAIRILWIDRDDLDNIKRYIK